MEVNISSNMIAGPRSKVERFDELVVIVSFTLVENNRDNGIGNGRSRSGLSQGNLHFNVKVLTVKLMLRRGLELEFVRFVFMAGAIFDVSAS